MKKMKGLRSAFSVLLLLALALMALTACAITLPQDKEVVNAEVLNIPEEGIYVGGFNDAGIRVKLTFDDGSTETAPLLESDLPEEYQVLVNIPGEHTFEMLYRGIRLSFDLTVKNPVCTVRFLNVLDQVVSTQTVNIGEDAVLPTADEMYVPGYFFTGRYDKPYTNITGDTEIRGIYEKVYTVTFYNVLDQVVSTQTVKHGEAAIAPTADEMYVPGYRFLGTFDKAFDNVTSNLDVHGNYVKTYTVTFYNGNKEAISVQTVDIGGNAIEPTEEERYVEGYLFKYWDRDFTNVQSDLNVNGFYIRCYVVNYSSNDEMLGTVSGSVPSGAYVAPSTNVTLKASPIGTATFLGWYQGETLVSEDVSYTFMMLTKAVTFVAKFSKNDDTPAYTREGDYIYFGEYPQTLKAEGVTVTSSQDSRGYYLGSDGCYYAKVTATPNGSNYTFSTGASVSEGTTYYFKVELIRWRILSEDGETALILCDSIIAKMAYQPDYYYNGNDGEYYTTANGAPAGTYANNYEYSAVRAWLNDQFYKTAFSDLERALILTTTVDNSAASTGGSSNPYACANTEDKIFLLSYKEVTNSEYGFASSYSTYDEARRMLTSDYARATGAAMSTSSGYYGNGFWWLRSPNYDRSYGARGVTSDGYAAYYILHVDRRYNGVVPALQIRLSAATHTCEDLNMDHLCDNGCDAFLGEHTDLDLNHQCDYGCDEWIGDCKDADMDHACDYGCGLYFGEHADTDGDGLCDYCGEWIGGCFHVDADLDHWCDNGCGYVFPSHRDINRDHICDYGCNRAIGVHADMDGDGLCDYCGKPINPYHEHTDNAPHDHVCDVGSCGAEMWPDTNKDHFCDVCGMGFGRHVDANADSICDYCSKAI